MQFFLGSSTLLSAEIYAFPTVDVCVPLDINCPTKSHEKSVFKLAFLFHLASVLCPCNLYNCTPCTCRPTFTVASDFSSTVLPLIVLTCIPVSLRPFCMVSVVGALQVNMLSSLRPSIVCLSSPDLVLTQCNIIISETFYVTC